MDWTEKLMVRAAGLGLTVAGAVDIWIVLKLADVL